MNWMLIFFLFLLSCQETDLIYSYKIPPGATFAQSYQVKEFENAHCHPRQVDILWAIDNSGSMEDEIESIRNGAQQFIEGLTNSQHKFSVHWKLGLISLDLSQAPFLGFLAPFKKGAPEPIHQFQWAVKTLGDKMGWAEETGMDAILAAFSQYPDFLREKACLAIIMASDEPDHSRAAPDYFLHQIRNLKGHLETTKIFTIVAADDFLNCPPGEDMDYRGSSYEALVNKTQGEYYSICSDNFGQDLAKIGEKIANFSFQPTLMLGPRPLPSTITVTTDEGVPLPGGPQAEGGLWHYDLMANAIVFYSLDFFPDENQSVLVKYELDQGWPEL